MKPLLGRLLVAALTTSLGRTASFRVYQGQGW
jgi:hypothetical protein